MTFGATHLAGHEGARRSGFNGCWRSTEAESPDGRRWIAVASTEYPAQAVLLTFGQYEAVREAAIDGRLKQALQMETGARMQIDVSSGEPRIYLKRHGDEFLLTDQQKGSARLTKGDVEDFIDKPLSLDDVRAKTLVEYHGGFPLVDDLETRSASTAGSLV
jgi:hypothetical protein